jgi:hypothetical protein
LHRLCGLLNEKFSVKDPLYRCPVQDFSLQDFLSALFFFAGIYQGISASTAKHLIPRGKNKDIHALFTIAYNVFEDWPNNFCQFLHWRIEQERKEPLIRNRLKSVLYRDFGKLYTGLYDILSGSQFDFIRNAFINYLVEEWDGGGLLFNDKKIAEKHFPYKWVSKVDAMRLLNADEQAITQLVETGRLKMIVRSKGMKRLFFVEISGIANLAHEKTYRVSER